MTTWECEYCGRTNPQGMDPCPCGKERLSMLKSARLHPAQADVFEYYLRMYATLSHDPGKEAVVALGSDVLSTARCFMTRDRLSGVAIQHDGTGIGMYSFVQGRASRIVAQAIRLGAWRLECYDMPSLVQVYEHHGGVIVSRTPFDPAKAEPRFLQANLGTPDYIVVELRPELRCP